MTRLALIEPESAGGNWWAVVEVPWAKQKGPRAPRLVIHTLFSAALYHAEAVPPPPIRDIMVEFHQIRSAGRQPLWAAQIVEGSSEITRLLNIAYTCPDTHVHWAEAASMRDQFERALVNS